MALVLVGAISTMNSLVSGMRTALRTSSGNKALCTELVSRCDRLVQALYTNPRFTFIESVDELNCNRDGSVRELDPATAAFLKRLMQTMQRAHALVCVMGEKGKLELHMNRTTVSA
eukprot:gene30230-22334_t